MKAGFFINVGLLVLLIFLVWFTQKVTTEDASVTVSEIDAEIIQKIKINRRQNTLLLDKTEAGWQLTQPFTAPGNPIRIDLILSALNQPFTNSKPITDEMDLSIYGLDEPVATLTLDQHVMRFGDIAPLQQKRFVAFNDQVYLLEDSIAPMLTASANSFIDNRLFEPEMAITEMQLPNNTRFYLEAGQWHSSLTDLSKDEIQSFIDAWQKAAALQVSPETNETTGEAILVTVKDKVQPITLRLTQDEHRFTLVHSSKQLAYDFPKTILPTFIPHITP
jgi:hypothetical protein